MLHRQGSRRVGARYRRLALVQSPRLAARQVRAVPDQAGRQREPDLRPAGQGQLHQARRLGCGRAVKIARLGGCNSRRLSLSLNKSLNKSRLRLPPELSLRRILRGDATHHRANLILEHLPRLEPQRPFRGARVRERPLQVPYSSRPVRDFTADHLGNLVHRHGAPAPHVHRDIPQPTPLPRQQHGPNNVVHVHEIAKVRPVALHRQRLAPLSPRQKYSSHHRVSPARRLTLAVHHEEPQVDRG